MVAPDLVTLWCVRQDGETVMFLSEEDRAKWRGFWGRGTAYVWTVEWARELPDGRFLDMDLRTKRVTYKSEEE